MAYYKTGLRYRKKLAGLMCLSGYLPLSDKTAEERNAAKQDTPVSGHGRGDPLKVLIDRAEKSRDLLKQLGYQVEWHGPHDAIRCARKKLKISVTGCAVYWRKTHHCVAHKKSPHCMRRNFLGKRYFTCV